jgi:hypothetical protein
MTRDRRVASSFVTESPFVSVYETGTAYGPIAPLAAELYGILSELRDQEFDSAVYQLQAEVYDLLAPRIEGEDDLADYEVEAIVESHFGPLVRETNALLDRMAAEVEGHDVEHMTEEEIDTLLDRFEPHDTGLAPSFENFLEKVWAKAKKTVKKVAGAVKKGVKTAVKTVGKIATAPIALVLKKLKGLVKPLLSKVLKSAIDKLPEPLQDAARQAAQKLFGGKARTDATPEESEVARVEDEMGHLLGESNDATDEEIAYLQTELDLEIANLILADDETQQDTAVADYATRARRTGPGRRRRLRRARRRLAKDFKDLGDGDDPAPAVEQFIPALLPALKLGLKVIGRKRVVEAIARLVGNLLRPFVGPKMSAPLANAIVGTGLRLVGLEMSEDDKADAAANATAAVVEDTVRRVAQLPAEMLEDEIVLEAVVEEAFDEALVANFPPMPGRPDLVSAELPGSWHSRGEYKRFEPPIAVKITPTLARDLKSFGGASPTVLGHSLKDLVGRNAQVRLYEAVSGTWLSKISRDEKDVWGLGGIEEVKWRSIHPLTPPAASLLLKDMTMAGTKLIDPRFLQKPDLIDVGQRFYYIEVPGLTEGAVITHDSAFYYVLDCPQRLASMTLFIGEQAAQSIAKALRARDAAGAGKELAKLLLNVGRQAISSDLRDTVDIRKEMVEIENLAPVLARLVPVLKRVLLRWFLGKLVKWIAGLLVDRLIGDQFTRAADDPADGVSLKLTWRNPVGMDVVCRLLNSGTVPLGEFEKELRKLVDVLVATIPAPEIKAGYHRD